MSTSSSRTNANKKTSYVSDSERSKRLNANLIERRRMQNINSGFASLKKLLPPLDRKQTKAAILQQASQYILRLQRAVIQFKTENDTLRSALGRKNQTMTCAKHGSTQNNPHRIQPPSKHLDSKTPHEPKPTDDLLLTVKPHESNNIERHKRMYKRTVLPKPLHNVTEIHNFESSWRPFEHVKKFEPKVPQTSGLPNRIEVYPNAHAFDPSPLTPPISPGLNDSRVVTSNPSGRMSVASASPTFMTSPASKEFISHGSMCSPLSGTHRVKTPKRNIFQSSTKTTFEAVRHEKRTRPTQKTEREDGWEIETKRSKQKAQGNLQCILEAIDIIENTEKHKY